MGAMRSFILSVGFSPADIAAIAEAAMKLGQDGLAQAAMDAAYARLDGLPSVGLHEVVAAVQQAALDGRGRHLTARERLLLDLLPAD